MASSVAPLAFGARAPARTSRGAFHLPARRAVAVGRVAPPLRSRGGTTLGSLASSSAPAATDASSGASVDLLGLRGGGADAAAAAAAVFERVDDVVMGGVSSSTIAPDPAGRECLVWAGKCRAEGGGFAGARSVALQTPLDLSAFDGLALTCGFESDAEPERRTWKATVRTQNDRGEMVYQATFAPPVADAADAAADIPRETRIPWDAFRLVRGPTVVPDVPPLSAEQCGSVYGLGLIMSRFSARGPMPEFREGPFRLAVHALGVYSSSATDASASASASAAPSLLAAASANAGKRASENRGSRNVVTFLLSPLIKLAFDEKRRRRKRARALLRDRFGVGSIRARFAFGQTLKKKRRGGDALGAAAEGARELAGDIVAAGLTLPLRLVFILLAKVARLVRAVKGQKQLPKMR
jgi:hypothetical protein